MLPAALREGNSNLSSADTEPRKGIIIRLFNLTRLMFLHDLTNLVAMTLGESPSGSHVPVLVDIWYVVPEEELSVFAAEAALCTFGLVNGLCRVLLQSGCCSHGLPSSTTDTITCYPTSSTF